MHRPAWVSANKCPIWHATWKVLKSWHMSVENNFRSTENEFVPWIPFCACNPIPCWPHLHIFVLIRGFCLDLVLNPTHTHTHTHALANTCLAQSYSNLYMIPWCASTREFHTDILLFSSVPSSSSVSLSSLFYVKRSSWPDKWTLFILKRSMCSKYHALVYACV